MEKYQIRFYLLFIDSIIIGFLLIKSLLKLKAKEKKSRELLLLLTLYICTAFLSVIFYAIAAFISWQVPGEFSYEFQCLIWSWVFCANSIGTIILGRFIETTFFINESRTKKFFHVFYLYGGIILFLIFLLGGIFGFSHEPLPPPPVNNNDLKIEYYIIYNLYILPIILTGISEVIKLIRKLKDQKIIENRMKYLAIFFFGVLFVFIFGLLDLFSEIFGHLTIIIIMINTYFAYRGFVN